MIIGVILDNGTPVIELKVRGAREESTIEGILDTGFNGFICLPTSIAVTLGLELIARSLQNWQMAHSLKRNSSLQGRQSGMALLWISA